VLHLNEALQILYVILYNSCIIIILHHVLGNIYVTL